MWFRLAAPLTLLLFLTPITLGLIGTILPAFGYLPAIGGGTLSLQPWRDLWDYPGISASVWLTISSGVTATILAYVITLTLIASFYHSPIFHWVRTVIAPILAIPHSAFAIGFAFLIAPSGWVIRLLSPWATNWTYPPDVAIVHDPAGLALIGGLLLKEIPYLLLMIIGALNQVRGDEALRVAQTLGYRPVIAWFKLILPQIYPQIRLPIYVVLAFSLSVVDVALILAPNTPLPLSPLIVSWFSHYDFSRYFPAAAGACLQLLIVMAALLVWHLGERVGDQVLRWWVWQGHRGGNISFSLIASFPLALGMIILSGLSMIIVMIWSVTRSWYFPDALPESWTLTNWQNALDQLWQPFATMMIIGLSATLIAVVLVIGCLENEHRRQINVTRWSLWILYLPLLIPQTAFLFGTQVALVHVSLDGTWLGVIWIHLLFVLPYVFLSLADVWRAFDLRYVRTALSLGISPFGVLLRVKLPMMLRPFLIAMAVGFAVSAAQYLPTLFAGAGRYATLTTEAVTLASSSDRRLIGVYTFAQSLVPLIGYLGALLIPVWVYRHRAGMQQGG